MTNNLRIAFISRPTLFTVRGGDTIQMERTAKELRAKGVSVDILTGNTPVEYSNYDILHFFNLIRPANILGHLKNSRLPFVISPVYVDYSIYEKGNKAGLRGRLMTVLSKWSMEYVKVIGRYFLNKEPIGSVEYLLRGHKSSMQYILSKSAHILPNSFSEIQRLQKEFLIRSPYTVVPNAIDPDCFSKQVEVERDDNLIVCVARIEGSKNQLNLIRALKNTGFRLILIGKAAPNHQQYLSACKAEADDTVEFLGELPHEAIQGYYHRAHIHAMPSWFETTGLSSLEAAYCGCKVVMGSNGDEKEYFGDQAFYCNPASPESIREAILKAAQTPHRDTLQEKIDKNFTWQKAAEKTLEAYQTLSP